jgi:hypothetical protein
MITATGFIDTEMILDAAGRSRKGADLLQSGDVLQGRCHARNRTSAGAASGELRR